MIALESLRWRGEGLSRPECVLAHRSGVLVVPCWEGTGGVDVLCPDGTQRRVLADAPKVHGRDEAFRPNGIALEEGGTVLLAHLGETAGGVYRLWSDGGWEAVTEAVDGAPMPPANFCTRDHAGRLWFTVSTRVTPRADDYRRDAATGFIALHDGEGGTRIVADGLGYTNEVAVSPDGARLWVNETFARRTTRFEVGADGALMGRTVVAEHGHGTFPDGLALDEEGGVWVVSIVSNRVLRIAPDGGVETMLEEADADHLAWVEAAYEADAMGRAHLDGVPSRHLRQLSNVAFGGEDRRDAWLGCLLGDRIAGFRAPVAGMAPAHWDVDLGALA